MLGLIVTTAAAYRGQYRGDLATLDVHVAAIENIVAFAGASGVNEILPAALPKVFSEAARSGHGEEEMAAGAGEIVVSRTVRDLVVGSELRFTDRGEHELKGIDEPWHLYAVA